MTFKNDSSQAERKQFVKDTFHSRTHDESGGRWQRQDALTLFLIKIKFLKIAAL
jgi:hypothetical protein